MKSDATNAVDVVAALIFENDKFLICRRPRHKARGLLWEFAGGKVEPGETEREALVRECKEELNISLSADEKFMETIHVYPDITVRLSVYLARILQGVPQKLEHEALQWITPEEIANYEFCPADQPILEEIVRRFGKKSGN